MVDLIDLLEFVGGSSSGRVVIDKWENLFLSHRCAFFWFLEGDSLFNWHNLLSNLTEIASIIEMLFRWWPLRWLDKLRNLVLLNGLRGEISCVHLNRHQDSILDHEHASLLLLRQDSRRCCESLACHGGLPLIFIDESSWARGDEAWHAASWGQVGVGTSERHPFSLFICHRGATTVIHAVLMYWWLMLCREREALQTW